MQESWSGLPFPYKDDLLDPRDWGLNPGLLHCRHILYRWATREAFALSRAILWLVTRSKVSWTIPNPYPQEVSEKHDYSTFGWLPLQWKYFLNPWPVCVHDFMNKCIDCELTPLVTRVSCKNFIEMQDELFLHLETGMSHDLEMKEMNYPCYQIHILLGLLVIHLQNHQF